MTKIGIAIKGIKQPRNKRIILRMDYRDELCSHCKKKFRVGQSCDGYVDFQLMGYQPVGLKRHGYFCSRCMDEFLYKFMGEPSLLDHDKAPTALYSWNGKNNGFPKRADHMMINGRMTKHYNKKKLEIAVRKFAKKMNKEEPWNMVDYFVYAGLKKSKWRSP